MNGNNIENTIENNLDIPQELSLEQFRDKKISDTYLYLFLGDGETFPTEATKEEFEDLQNLSLSKINKFMREYFFQINNSYFTEKGWKDFTSILREIENEIKDNLFEEKYGEINMIKDFTNQKLSFIVYIAIENRWGEDDFPNNELPNYWKMLSEDDDAIINEENVIKNENGSIEEKMNEPREENIEDKSRDKMMITSICVIL